MDRLAAVLPAGVELINSPTSHDVGDLDGVGAVVALGKIDRAMMQRGTFGLIQTVGTGYDNIDLTAATELGIWVAHLPASKTGNAESVAELAILLMLALSRRLSVSEANLRQGRWAQPVGRALLGKAACLIGLGDIGLALAERLHAFGMKLTATRRNLAKGGPEYVRVYAAEAFADAVHDADYVIVCARADATNVHLIDAHVIRAIKPGAILINIARGSLVDHDALREALESGHLRGAGLDVFWEEPVNPDHPLFKMDQVLATPHIAGVTDVNL